MREGIIRLAGIAPVVGSVLALAGCGGAVHPKASTATTPGASSGTAAYITQADAICQQGRTALAQFSSEARTLGALGTPKAFALAVTVSRRIQSLEQGELGRLKALKLPAGDAAKVTAYLNQEGVVLAAIGRLAKAFAKGDKAAITATERDASRQAATGKGLAQGYGFKVCGNGASGTGLS